MRWTIVPITVMVIFSVHIQSCSHTGANGNPLAQYIMAIEDENNGLKQTREHENIVFRIKLEPPVYKFLKEGRIRTREADLAEVLKEASAYDGIYFELSASATDGHQPALDRFLLSESIKPESEWIKMVCHSDTLAPIGMHFIAGQNVSGKSVLNIVFPKHTAWEEGFDVLLAGPFAPYNILAFRYTEEVLKNIPTLNN